MDKNATAKIEALLQSVTADMCMPQTQDCAKLFDYTVSPFRGLSGFTLIGHVPPRASRDVRDSCLGIGFETMDRNTFEPEKVIPKLGSTGVKYARLQTGWIKSEKEKGVYDFAWLDKLVDSILEQGIQPWLSVSFGNPLYTPNDHYAELWKQYTGENWNKMPGHARAYVAEVPLLHGEEAMQAFSAYAAALAGHFKGRVQVYEIWNEPEHFWLCNNVDYAAKYGCRRLAKDFTELVRRTGDAIRKADPTAKIAANSCGSGNSYIYEIGRCGLGKYIDIYIYHYYGNSPESIAQPAMNQLRACLEIPGKKLEIWQGESGRASGNNVLVSRPSQYNQAKYMVRRFFTDAGMGVPLTSTFTVSDFRAYYPDGSDQQYGMFTLDSVTPKLNYYVCQGLAGLFDGLHADPRILATFGAPLRVFEDTMHYRTDKAAFRRSGVPVFTLWYGGNNDIPHPAKIGTAKFFTAPVTEFTDPIAIDPLRREIYRIDGAIFPKETDIRPALVVQNFPVVDYPLIVTDLAVFEDYL